MGTPPDNRDYYEVLHVSRDAPLEIIRGSYRTLMQQLKNHPDLGGDAATAALINEAYAVLTDPERRAEYDARLDVIARLAQGMSEGFADNASAVKTDRVIDPFRECLFCEAPHDFGTIIEIDASCDNCGSPLCAAEKQRIESVGQRAVERIDKRGDITFYTHWPQPKGFAGHTEDISLNGLRFVTKQELSEGQRIKIVGEVVEAVGHITHCIHARHGWTVWCVAGVSFATLRFVRSVGGFVSDRV